MTLRIPFNPGRLNWSQSPSVLSKIVNLSSDILHSGCNPFHHASKAISSAGTFVIEGRQVGERA